MSWYEGCVNDAKKLVDTLEKKHIPALLNRLYVQRRNQILIQETVYESNVKNDAYCILKVKLCIAEMHSVDRSIGYYLLC